VVKRAGFTLTDLVVIIVVVGVLLVAAGLILPMFGKAKSGPGPENCVNNLKQVDMAFPMWANDHNNNFPMQVSTNDGGAREFLDGANFYMAFAVMSNEISVPGVLVCPQDKDKTKATNFTEVNRNHLSYFLGLDATAELTNGFLCGDGNLTNGLPPRNGILDVAGSQPVGWTGAIHHFRGNIALVNLYTWQFTNPDLRKAIQKTGMQTNRLALP
jgi:competence protein ComGC